MAGKAGGAVHLSYNKSCFQIMMPLALGGPSGQAYCYEHLYTRLLEQHGSCLALGEDSGTLISIEV